jgi:hypothetical protein
MIEFIETTNRDGETSAYLKAEGMPKGAKPEDYKYHIRVRADGWCECRSRAYGAGSTRYYSFRTYAEAMEHGVKWAKRKIAEAKREQVKKAKRTELGKMVWSYFGG